MGFLDLFSNRARLTSSKIGKLLGELLRETLSKMFEKQSLLIIQKRFIEKGCVSFPES